MATTELRTQAPTLTPVPQIVAHRVEREPRGWTSWVTTTDHKKIGIMYLVLTFVFFLLGGIEALLIRLQLAQADNTLLTPQTYNELFTMHGTTMIFLFVVPVWAAFGNYLIPLMIGARDMAFPKLNALSFWLLASGGIVFYASIFFSPPECGWTCYTPLSSSNYLPSGGVDAWIFLIHLTGLSSLVGAVNFYATIANMRAPGMGWGRLPLFCWTILIYAVLLILALPVIAGGVTLLLTESAGTERKGFAGSFAQIGVPMGVILGNGVFLIVGALVSQEQFTSWGWRVPFLASIVMLAISIYIRLKLDTMGEGFCRWC